MYVCIYVWRHGGIHPSLSGSKRALVISCLHDLRVTSRRPQLLFLPARWLCLSYAYWEQVTRERLHFCLASSHADPIQAASTQAKSHRAKLNFTEPQSCHHASAPHAWGYTRYAEHPTVWPRTCKVSASATVPRIHWGRSSNEPGNIRLRLSREPLLVITPNNYNRYDEHYVLQMICF